MLIKNRNSKLKDEITEYIYAGSEDALLEATFHGGNQTATEIHASDERLIEPNTLDADALFSLNLNKKFYSKVYTRQSTGKRATSTVPFTFCWLV